MHLEKGGLGPLGSPWGPPGVPQGPQELNKAVYTAALVTDRWAGAENLKKQLYDRQTKRLTDQATD